MPPSTSGKLWHWKFQDGGEHRYFVYIGRKMVYVQGLRPAAEHIRIKARWEDLLADLGVPFDGDDAKVEQLLQKHKLDANRIPYEMLEGIELLPLMEPQVRIRYRSNGKARKMKLKFGGDMKCGTFYEELRAAISPTSPVEKKEMDTATILAGPALALGFSVLFGWAFYAVAEDSKVEGTAKIIAPFANAIGRVPILIVTSLVIVISLSILVNRLRKRPTISVWKVPVSL